MVKNGKNTKSPLRGEIEEVQKEGFTFDNTSCHKHKEGKLPGGGTWQKIREPKRLSGVFSAIQ